MSSSTRSQVSHVSVGPAPSSVTCPSCGAVVTTRMELNANKKTHLYALVLCLCCCIPCAIIPYFMDSCKSADHYCPKCNAYIGTFGTILNVGRVLLALKQPVVKMSSSTRSQVSHVSVGPAPSSVTCPSCGAVVTTRVERNANKKTHLYALVLCIFCLCPCAIIPYFMDSCKSSDHYCPKCNAYIGSYDG